MRQVLEIRGCPPGEAWRVQSEIRQIYYQRIVPLIEKALAKVSSPERIFRIETLEIDLGAVPLNDLKQTLVSEFETVFTRELTVAVSRIQRGSSNGEDGTLTSQLELFIYYLKTGAVPWWADLARPNLLEENLEFLIQKAPMALTQVMQEPGDQERAIRRIVLSYSDHLLDRLCGALAPRLDAALPGFAGELARLLETASVAKTRSSTGRNLFWEETLQLVHQKEGSSLDLSSLFRTIFMRFAHRSGISYRSLISAIDETLKTGSPRVSPQAAMIAGDLYREICQPVITSGSPSESIRAELLELVERLAPSMTGLRIRLQTILSPTSPSVLGRMLAKLRLWESRSFDGETLTSELIDELIASELRSEFGSRRAGKQASEGARKSTPIDLRFSESDEIYVNNSGLVLLWPFLKRFFQQLGLLDTKQFNDQAAVQRAVGLLQYLVSEDAPPQEYLLPLNKVLCGMDLDELFDFGPPVTEVEIEQCRQMLIGVIEHAPILRKMSIAGFRNTFLFRKGQLSSRNGVWRLRVERETYDLVLDRFPWSVSWLKLPWMEFPMHVEW
jgi:hypothetical protein